MNIYKKTTVIFKQKLYPVFRRFIIILGWIALIAIILTFTDIPYLGYYKLGTVNAGLDEDPDYIIMLGGTGMPSPKDLMRTYFTASAWKQAPWAMIYIVFPSDTSRKEKSPELLMAKDLKIRGVDSTKIFFESKGYSTRSQALNIKKLIGKHTADTCVIRIVTSPDHMYRAIRTFRKVGFYKVGGSPTFEQVVSEEELICGENTKTEKFGLSFRYRIWSYMIYEITSLRELCAIAYYKIRGWI